MVFCNFFSVHFYRDEEEEKEEQQQEKEEKEKKLHSRYRKTFTDVRSSCQYSKGEKDISKKSTENQQKQKPTGTKNLTYHEKWLTAKVITFPSNRGSVSSFSVISIHSFFSELDSLKRMRTRATDISMSFL